MKFKEFNTFNSSKFKVDFSVTENSKTQILVTDKFNNLGHFRKEWNIYNSVEDLPFYKLLEENNLIIDLDKKLKEQGMPGLNKRLKIICTIEDPSIEEQFNKIVEDTFKIEEE